MQHHAPSLSALQLTEVFADRFEEGGKVEAHLPRLVGDEESVRLGDDAVVVTVEHPFRQEQRVATRSITQ